MTRALTKLIIAVGTAAVVGLTLSGCGKFKQKAPVDPAKSRIEAKRQQVACASPAAYDQVKGAIFDRAIRERNGDRASLDTLSDYSQARMEHPIVEGRDPVLDLTRCKGRLVLEIPPGAERGLGGERHLQALINYSAQEAADGSGLVYTVDGAEPIVARLAAFNLSGVAFRPPPAIDGPAPAQVAGASAALVQADVPPEPPIARRLPATAAEQRPPRPAPQLARAPQRGATPKPAAVPQRAPESPPAMRVPRPTTKAANSETQRSLPVSTRGGSGEATVRAFYNALGQGNGAGASAQIIPEKRSSRAYSPEGISQFYGRLAEPIRLTEILPLSDGSYRVRYRYAAGRSHCNGSAVIRVANRSGRNLIRSIRALNGC